MARSNTKSQAGVKCIKAALHHRRGDKYLFANKKEFRGKSYRQVWWATACGIPFEQWLKQQGVLTA